MIIRGTRLLEKTLDCKTRTIVHVGGSGSSKSYSVAQAMIKKLTCEDNKQILVTRKTMPALKRSSYGLIIDLLKEYDLYDVRCHNKSDSIYTYGSNTMWFVSLDEPTKIKSIKGGLNYIWLEEADEFTYDDYMAYRLQLRGVTRDEPNQIFLSFNPIDESGWIPTKLLKEDNVEVIHSTHEDNPFLNEDYRAVIKGFINEDENYYRVYTLGEWGHLENLIYRKYRIIDFLPDMKEAQWCYGLDFGLVNPSALLKVYQLSNEFYLEERLYRSGLTNKDIIEFLSHEERGDIYADPTEKQMIAEICQAGYNAYEGHKEVKAGIDLCQRQTLNIPKYCVNLIKEIQGYQWKKDKNGNVLPEPVKIRDHLMDDMRYAIYGMTERYGYATASPGSRFPHRAVSNH